MLGVDYWVFSLEFQARALELYSDIVLKAQQFFIDYKEFGGKMSTTSIQQPQQISDFRLKEQPLQVTTEKRPRSDTFLIDPANAGDKPVDNDESLRVTKRKSNKVPIVKPRSLEISNVQEMQARVIERVTDMVLSLCQEEDGSRDKFSCDSLPQVQFKQFAERLILNTNLWADETPGLESIGVRSAVAAVEFLERSAVPMSLQSVHKYFMTAFLVGIKLMFDYYVPNTFFAGICGVTLQEMNVLEIQFFNILEWNFSISIEAFQKQMIKILN